MVEPSCDMLFDCSMFRIFLTFLICFCSNAFAFEDPTNKKPFVPWLWNEQLKPTIENSLSTEGLAIIGTSLAGSALAHEYDTDVYEHNRRGKDLIFDSETSGFLGTLGGGGLGIGIAAAQLFLDQENGLKHARTIMLTSLSHVTSAFIVSRKRPDLRHYYLPFDSAYPSGHASSIFATATALSYAYGWVAGAPSFALATAISAARVSENAHWLSDVVAGAGLGIFWGVASYKVPEEKPEVAKSAIQFLPPQSLRGGLLLSIRVGF
jgi:hypothetical protein